MADQKGWFRHRRRASAGVRAATESLRRIAPRRGIQRMRTMGIFALQAALTAGLAFWFATDVIGHEQAFFAPIAGVISIGINSGKHMRRGMEIVIGAAIGIAIGDLVITQIGGGPWQITIVVFVAIMLATFVDRGILVPSQAASSAVLVATLLPPGDQGALDRVVDALVGGIIGLIILAVIPRNPLRAVRREMAGLISKAALVLDDVAEGIEDRDATVIGEALETARGTQAAVNAMQAAMTSGDETIALSPIYWSAKRYSTSLNRALVPVDNVMRNTRVLARRAEIMVDDHIVPDPEMAKTIREIADTLGHLGAVYEEGGSKETRQELLKIPELTRRFQIIAGRTDLSIADGSGLSGMMVLGQCRSIIVDALQICGMSRESAMAALKPTVDHPWQTPEVWGADDEPQDPEND
ncbi:FUSC family protein [Corynebacterium variabile]|nr:FUSC family protein [Corynebacterium variabile]AEK35750.1 putative membrane protein [Corynebacterium variabile DSM 44702]